MTATTMPTSAAADSVAGTAAGLSDEQRAVVEHRPDGAHLLVLAAPGSGKTRVIAERIRWLLATGAAEPDQVLAMTFTRRAAQHLCARIGNDDVWAGTFHAVCVDILQEFGADAGLRTPIRIADEPRQQNLVERAAASAGVLLPLDDLARAKEIERLQRAISARKLGDDPPADGPPTPFDDIARWYATWLDEGGWLDFDDLLLVASRVLLDHPPARAATRERLRFVFIDEFHDVSAEQYDLVRQLAPSGGAVRVMAVADRDQAIFGWRGARLAELDDFRSRYAAQECRLSRNYRSTPQVVAAARAVLDGPMVEAVRADGFVTGSIRCPTPEAEADELVRLVGRAVASGNYRPRDIAVLYRTHKRGDPAEAALLAAGYAVNREARGRFFAQSGVQDVLRVLDLALAMRDEGFTGALNWPRVTVDEVSMARLRRLAAAEGVPVCDIARRVEDWAVHLSPLTRAALREFRSLVDDRLAPAIDDPIDATLDRLLPLLASRRCPVSDRDRPALDEALARLGRPLRAAADRLLQSLARRRVVAIRTPGGDHAADADVAAATVILRRLFEGYLGLPLLVLPPGRFAPDGAFTIHLGDRRQPSFAGIGLARANDASIGMQAWRLATLVLVALERADGDDLVLFDVETGGRDAARTELLEVAALPIVDGDASQGFVSYVRPSGSHAISSQASKVNGIRWEHVVNADPAATVVPRLLDAIAGKTLVGHNIERFDLVVLRRVARELGLEPPRNPAIDTLKLARRLLPDEPSYRLEALARRFAFADRQQHRAEDDALLNADVFRALAGELDRERDRAAMTEALPLVALSIRAAGIPVRDDAATLVTIGARARRLGWGTDLVAAWAGATPAAGDGERWLAAAGGGADAADDAWQRLEGAWREAAAAFCHRARDRNRSLGAFLRHAALAQPVDFVPAAMPDGSDETGPDARFVPPSERIAMLTAHSAKGREWPLVFIVGAESDQFPNWTPHPSPEHDAEERRVLYVAMTRAQQRLILLHAETANGHRRGESPFLAPLGDDLLHRAHRRE